MWILFTPAPRPDAPNWLGRRWLAALDAVAWPGAWAFGVAHVPMSMGIVGTLVIAWAALSAAARLHRAVFRNERYRFTTWRWGRVLVGMVLLGLRMKLVATA